MREIKFRAWNDNKKEMFDPVGEIDLNNERVMQYTGLKDKNGKEIYEGDIIEWTGEPLLKDVPNKNKYIIKWEIFHDIEKYEITGSGFKTENPDRIEIIGNIYENPELIK